MSLTYDHKTYTTEVNSHFETYLSDLLCVMTYCLVYSRRLGGHVINVVEVWPQDLHHWGEFALWNLSFWPPLCDDLLSCLFTKIGRPRDKCRWRMTTRLTPLRWFRTLNLSFWPPLCDDLLSCLLTKTGRPRDKCRWSMTTRLTPLR
jgi:hypothetical protein